MKGSYMKIETKYELGENVYVIELATVDTHCKVCNGKGTIQVSSGGSGKGLPCPNMCVEGQEAHYTIYTAHQTRIHRISIDVDGDEDGFVETTYNDQYPEKYCVREKDEAQKTICRLNSMLGNPDFVIEDAPVSESTQEAAPRRTEPVLV